MRFYDTTRLKTSPPSLFSGGVPQSYIELYSKINNLRDSESIKELAHELGLAPLFSSGNTGSCVYPKKLKDIRGRAYVSHHWPEKISLEGKTFVNSSVVLAHYPNGKIIGGAVKYKAPSGEDFFIRGKVGKYFSSSSDKNLSEAICLGSLPPGYLLYHENELANLKSHSTIFLCASLSISEHLNCWREHCYGKFIIIKNPIEKSIASLDDSVFIPTRPTERQRTVMDIPPLEYYATSPYGGMQNLFSTDFNSLRNQKVIYIPSVKREHFFQAFKLGKMLKEVGVKSFKIFPALALTKETALSLNLKDPWENSVIQNAVVLNSRENIEKMIAQALPIDKFEKWATDVGILPKPESLQKNTPSGFDKYRQPTEAEIAGHAAAKPKMDIFGTQGELGVLLAEKDTGKSFLAASVAVARATGVGLLGFESLKPESVLYVDAENTTVRLRLIIARSASALEVDSEKVSENLITFCVKSDKEASMFDLTQKASQEKIEGMIKERKVQFVVLDNLLSLVPKFKSRGVSSWSDIKSWLDKMEKIHGVAFLVVHHTKLGGEGAGTSDIEILGRSNVKLLSSKAIKGTNDSERKAFEKYAGQQGALFKFSLDKSKRYPSHC